jgi:hypothetical protein
MVRTLNLNTDIPTDRKLRITLPADVLPGPAEIVLVVSSSADSAPSTLGKLLDSEFVGMWRDRADITDSFEFAAIFGLKAGSVPPDDFHRHRRFGRVSPDVSGRP